MNFEDEPVIWPYDPTGTQLAWGSGAGEVFQNGSSGYDLHVELSSDQIKREDRRRDRARWDKRDCGFG